MPLLEGNLGHQVIGNRHQLDSQLGVLPGLCEAFQPDQCVGHRYGKPRRATAHLEGPTIDLQCLLDVSQLDLHIAQVLPGIEHLRLCGQDLPKDIGCGLLPPGAGELDAFGHQREDVDPGLGVGQRTLELGRGRC